MYMSDIEHILNEAGDMLDQIEADRPQGRNHDESRRLRTWFDGGSLDTAEDDPRLSLQVRRLFDSVCCAGADV